MTAILWVLNLLSSSKKKKKKRKTSKQKTEQGRAKQQIRRWQHPAETAGAAGLEEQTKVIFKLGLPSIQKLPGEVRVGAGAPDWAFSMAELWASPLCTFLYHGKNNSTSARRGFCSSHSLSPCHRAGEREAATLDKESHHFWDKHTSIWSDAVRDSISKANFLVSLNSKWQFNNTVYKLNIPRFSLLPWDFCTALFFLTFPPSSLNYYFFSCKARSHVAHTCLEVTL